MIKAELEGSSVSVEHGASKGSREKKVRGQAVDQVMGEPPVLGSVIWSLYFKAALLKIISFLSYCISMVDYYRPSALIVPEVIVKVQIFTILEYWSIFQTLINVSVFGAWKYGTGKAFNFFEARSAYFSHR